MQRRCLALGPLVLCGWGPSLSASPGDGIQLSGGRWRSLVLGNILAWVEFQQECLISMMGEHIAHIGFHRLGEWN